MLTQTDQEAEGIPRHNLDATTGDIQWKPDSRAAGWRGCAPENKSVFRSVGFAWGKDAANYFAGLLVACA